MELLVSAGQPGCHFTIRAAGSHSLDQKKAVQSAPLKLQGPKAPTDKMPFAVSLRHKVTYNRSFLCMEVALMQ